VPDHWYAWDIDLCWIDVVVGAGVFASAEDALCEWRDAVGAAALGAALSPCPTGMTAELPAPRLRTGPPADMLQGDEPRGLICEHYRLRRRARDLTGPAGAVAGSSPFDVGHAPDASADWYAARHDDVPGAVTEAAGTVYEMWGPHAYPDERSFHACSPHRIQMSARRSRMRCWAFSAGTGSRRLAFKDCGITFWRPAAQLLMSAELAVRRRFPSPRGCQ